MIFGNPIYMHNRTRWERFRRASRGWLHYTGKRYRQRRLGELAFTVADNKVGVAHGCPTCDGYADPGVGLVIVDEDGYELCHECAPRLAPDLHAVVALHREELTRLTSELNEYIF